ncbi:MAG: xanthine dehydrogenase molybdopterin binding subunit [Methylobacteriaceae bacterium]|nr:xanthine dehydrogenase molybdopterin binding subunit [Methylobacteriaceae bacterium]
MADPAPSTARDRIRGGVGAPQAHDSALKHTTGEALYIDDLPEPAGLLHAALGLADRARARILSMSLDRVRAAPGVVAVLTAADVPGHNDIGPTHRGDEPIFPDSQVAFHGQPLFAVIAASREAARRAARLADVDYEDHPHRTTIEDAVAAGGDLVCEPMTLVRGDVEAALAAAPKRLRARMSLGGQEHFYLEGQIALAIPGEDGAVLVHSSTQHPSETQTMIALALGLAAHDVTVEVRRMGGGFGGKESQANHCAVVAAMAAVRLGRAVKLRLDRDEDMVATGKRHDFLIDYDVGFDETGRIAAVDFLYAARCGFSADLSGPVTDRALFHCDNAYFYPHVRARSLPLRTDTVSNTAFRGFGGPQGMVGAERVVEEVAFALGMDPLDVRKANLYAPGRDLTPYHQPVEDELGRDIIADLERRCDYRARRAALRAANAQGGVLRRGLALTPVKFGISFTATLFNQAGALINIYRDGSILLNHGGTEMGQGLDTKVAQVVAEEFQVDLDRVRITATSTAKVPNTSATAASSGADLNGMAAQAAARTLKQRLVDFAVERFAAPAEQIVFLPNRVRVGNQEIAFAELIEQAYAARVSLSATGFYRTPDIHWDRRAGRGRPFYYFAYGAAASEVVVDTLTGEYRVERVDILHDVGDSLNPALDRGQIEGGFVQGMGWLTTEELWWDAKGRLRTHAPSTYKIPLASDRPRIFNVDLLHGRPNAANTVYRSKAVGEPPLMLAISVLHALSDAVASLGGYRVCPRLDAPATPERVLMAIERLRG